MYIFNRHINLKISILKSSEYFLRQTITFFSLPEDKAFFNFLLWKMNKYSPINLGVFWFIGSCNDRHPQIPSLSYRLRHFLKKHNKFTSRPCTLTIMINGSLSGMWCGEIQYKVECFPELKLSWIHILNFGIYLNTKFYLLSLNVHLAPISVHNSSFSDQNY